MKKFLSILLLIFLTVTAIGCSSSHPSNAESFGNITPPSSTANPPPSQTGSSFGGGGGDAIEYFFYSISDLHTYVTTGSTDLADYEFRPSFPLRDMPSAKYMQAQGYLPIQTLLEIDDSLFDSREISFKIEEDGEIVYRYYLDNILIIVESTGSQTDKTTLSKFLEEKNISTDKISPYTSDSPLKDGYQFRTHGSIQIIYEVTGGVKRVANLMLNGFYVRIVSTYWSTSENRASDYEKFLTSPQTVGLAAFFSEEDDKFTSAVNKIDSVEKQ